MLAWLLTDASEITQPPAEFLSAAEQEQYAALRFAKRRDEWLLGRWTAKQLVQRVLCERAGKRSALNRLQIFNDPAGAPFVGGEGGEWNLTLSLSHSHGKALALVGDGMVGADIERIQPQPPHLFDPYFTLAEMAQVNQAAPELRETLLMALWSVKEAALKAIHKGLYVEPRTVEITFPPLQTAPPLWIRLGIAFEARQSPPLVGWWGVRDEFVLALAVAETQAPPLQPPAPCA